jgi:phage terminase large subunit-like protein
MQKNVINKLKNVCEEITKRKDADKLSTYNTGKIVHKKQLAFHKCNKRNRWVFGGNRTGKTECGAVEVVYLARGNHPYKQNKKDTIGWVVSLSKQVQRDVAQKKILTYLSPYYIEDVVMQSGKKDFPESGVIDYIKVKNVFGGTSIIGFKSCDQGREKFQGASLDYVWFDEEPTEEIYLECRMRVLDKKGQIFGTMTPLKGLTWVYDEIYLNAKNSKEVWYETMEWADNPFLDPNEVSFFEESLSEEDLESRKYGRFFNANGLVYKEFDEKVNVIDPFDVPKDWYDNISIDPGLNNPLSCHWYAVDYDGNVYVIAEHFEKNRDIDYHSQRIKEKCEQLDWFADEQGNYSALIDSAAGQHTLNGAKSVAELFYERGIKVNTKVNKDLFSGISVVKSYLKNSLGVSKLFIFKNCTNLIREIKSYFWGEGDNPIKRDDHALDELRYYLMTKPKAHFEPKTALQKYKDKIIRKVNFARKSFD